MIDASDILRSRYSIGARRPGVAIDCLGVVLALAGRMGLCAPDPWSPALEQQWRTGAVETTGFPCCWSRLPVGAQLQHGDVLLFHGSHPWSAIVCDGYVWSANHGSGPYRRPLITWERAPDEIWRHDATSHVGAS